MLKRIYNVNLDGQKQWDKKQTMSSAQKDPPKNRRICNEIQNLKNNLFYTSLANSLICTLENFKIYNRRLGDLTDERIG